MTFLRINSIRSVLFASLLATGLLGAGLLWSRQTRTSLPAPAQLNLPADLAKYKEWRTQLGAPELVPFDLWIRCVASTPTDWAKARKKYGPHTEQFIQVYANPIAMQSLGKGDAKLFQAGAVIAKEKLLDSTGISVAGVAFMIKRGTPPFASTGGWEFDYYPRSGDSASVQGCADCHRSAAKSDYVFGHYPSPGDPLHSTPPTPSR
jgi:hypothetical protein